MHAVVVLVVVDDGDLCRNLVHTTAIVVAVTTDNSVFPMNMAVA